jgi:hypothetical protein
VSIDLLREHGIDRFATTRALVALAEAGLLRIEDMARGKPVITLLDLEKDRQPESRSQQTSSAPLKKNPFANIAVLRARNAALMAAEMAPYDKTKPKH